MHHEESGRRTPSARSTLALAAAALCFLGGCVSLGTSPDLGRRICESPPRTAGSWHWSRVDTQLGPSTWRLDIHCDCTYDATVRTMRRLVRITERGDVLETEDRLDLGRANGERTAYDFLLKPGPEGATLELIDEKGEVNVFRQRAGFHCSG